MSDGATIVSVEERFVVTSVQSSPCLSRSDSYSDDADLLKIVSWTLLEVE